MRVDERKKEDPGEVVKNAATGYAVVVLCIVCFLIALMAITFVVKLAVGPGALAATAVAGA